VLFQFALHWSGLTFCSRFSFKRRQLAMFDECRTEQEHGQLVYSVAAIAQLKFSTMCQASSKTHHHLNLPSTIMLPVASCSSITPTNLQLEARYHEAFARCLPRTTSLFQKCKSRHIASHTRCFGHIGSIACSAELFHETCFRLFECFLLDLDVASV